MLPILRNAYQTTTTAFRVATKSVQDLNKVPVVKLTQIYKNPHLPQLESRETTIAYHGTDNAESLIAQIEGSSNGHVTVRESGKSINAGSVGGLFVNIKGPDEAVYYAGNKYLAKLETSVAAMQHEQEFGHPVVLPGNDVFIHEIFEVDPQSLEARKNHRQPSYGEQLSTFYDNFSFQSKE